MQENKTQTQQRTQNIKMMKSEPDEEDPSVNIVTQIGIAIMEDKGKQPEENVWVRKAADKRVGFDVKVKETFMEIKSSFANAKASTSRTQGTCTGKTEEVNTMQGVSVLHRRQTLRY